MGIMEKKMETIGIIGVIYGLYWGYMGIMEKKMEITRVYRDNGKTNWKLL